MQEPRRRGQHAPQATHSSALRITRGWTNAEPRVRGRVGSAIHTRSWGVTAWPQSREPGDGGGGAAGSGDATPPAAIWFRSPRDASARACAAVEEGEAAPAGSIERCVKLLREGVGSGRPASQPQGRVRFGSAAARRPPRLCSCLRRVLFTCPCATLPSGSCAALCYNFQWGALVRDSESITRMVAESDCSLH